MHIFIPTLMQIFCLLLALTLKALTSVPMSLDALHRALMSEVTLTDTTLWATYSLALFTTSCQFYGVTHKHTVSISASVSINYLLN